MPSSRATALPFLGAILSSIALSSPSASAFLFDDGTFDSPIPSFTDGSGWEAFGTPDAGAAIGQEDWANGAPGTGGIFGYAALGDGQSGIAFKGFSASAGGFYHDVPVDPARTYDFHIQSHAATNFFLDVADSGTGSVEINFTWYDGDPTNGGSIISSNNNDITATITDGGIDGEFPPGPSQAGKWQDWDYTGLTPPPGAAYLRATIQWSALAILTGGDETMRWDNAQLTTSLDPLNESQEVQNVLQLTHTTESGQSYTVKASANLMSFVDAGLPTAIGTGSLQEYFFPKQGAQNHYQVEATLNGLETTKKVRAAGFTGGDAGWQGFMNVFELPANGGGFVFGDPWGTDDLVSDISATVNAPGQLLTLSPNTIGDPNEFWYQNTSGTAPDPANPGGTGQLGNKSMEANLFYTYTNTSLSGQTVTFEGTVVSNSLTAAHTAVAFIKDFAPDFSSFTTVTAPLTPGPFSISLATDPGADRHIQFGFTMTGENVWVTDTAPFGTVVIEVEPVSTIPAVANLNQALAQTIAWDGQLGIHYLPEYSDDAGASWLPLLTTKIVGTGDRLEVAEPAGVVPGRIYRVSTPPPVPLVPGA